MIIELFNALAPWATVLVVILVLIFREEIRQAIFPKRD